MHCKLTYLINLSLFRSLALAAQNAASSPLLSTQEQATHVRFTVWQAICAGCLLSFGGLDLQLKLKTVCRSTVAMAKPRKKAAGSKTVRIFCAKCQAFLYKYQKVGPIGSQALPCGSSTLQQVSSRILKPFMWYCCRIIDESMRNA